MRRCVYILYQLSWFLAGVSPDMAGAGMLISSHEASQEMFSEVCLRPPPYLTAVNLPSTGRNTHAYFSVRCRDPSEPGPRLDPTRPSTVTTVD
jgi:hypothetical protein